MAKCIYDHVHLTPLGNYLFAREVFEQVVKDLPAGGVKCGENNGATHRGRVRALPGVHGTRSDPRCRGNGRIACSGRLSRNNSNHSEALQSMMLRASGPPEGFQDTVAQYQWAIAQAPADLTLHYKFGFFLFDFDRMAAAQQLILARPNDEFPVFLPDGTRIQ